jgi:hypothetical protein
LTFQGTFLVAPGSYAGKGGAAVTLQQSTDNGTTWLPVTFAQTNEGSFYAFNYQPAVTGNVWYRVFWTGVPWPVVQARSISSAGRVESLVPPQTATNGIAPQNTTNTQFSITYKYKIGTLNDLVTGIAKSINQATANGLCSLNHSLANSTSTALATLQTNVQTAIQKAVSDLQGSSAKASDVTTLSNQVSTLTNIAYAALAVAIVLGLAAILLARRKPS